jgi:hypothetical protein
MPGKLERSERLLEDALKALAGALTKSGAPWMVIGGIAIIARGVRRFTTDIDVAIRGDAIRPEKVLQLLARRSIVPRIDDALEFAQENLVLLLRHRPTGVDLDVSFAWSGFEHEALAAATITDFGKVRAPMCAPADLIVFKAIANRAKDVDDATALLDLYPKIDLAKVRKRVAELSALAEAPEVLHAFDAMTDRARGVGTRLAGTPVPPAARPRRRKRK